MNINQHISHTFMTRNNNKQTVVKRSSDETWDFFSNKQL